MAEVFDCRAEPGRIACVVPTWAAHLVAAILTKVTGRLHDFDAIGSAR